MAASRSPAPETIADDSPVLAAMSSEIREIDRQLAALSQATDSTAHTLIDATERLAQLVRWVAPQKRAAFEAELGSVLEACAFGDLFGQRLAESHAALTRLAERIEVTEADDPGEPQHSDMQADRRRSTLEGPQGPGGGLSQKAIDALFA